MDNQGRAQKYMQPGQVRPPQRKGIRRVFKVALAIALLALVTGALLVFGSAVFGLTLWSKSG